MLPGWISGWRGAVQLDAGSARPRTGWLLVLQVGRWRLGLLAAAVLDAADGQTSKGLNGVERSLRGMAGVRIRKMKMINEADCRRSRTFSLGAKHQTLLQRCDNFVLPGGHCHGCDSFVVGATLLGSERLEKWQRASMNSS
jgi:hypothetical protein